MNNKNLETTFKREVLRNLITMKDLGYNPVGFSYVISEIGVIDAVNSLIYNESASDVFLALCELKRLDLSIEVTILKNEYEDLFSDSERTLCRERLSEYGYFNYKKEQL